MMLRQVAMYFARETKGATAVEYALLAMLVGVALIGSVLTLGGEIFEIFNQAGNALSGD